VWGGRRRAASRGAVRMSWRAVQEAPPTTSTRRPVVLCAHALGAMAVGGVRRSLADGAAVVGWDPGRRRGASEPGGAREDVPRDQHSCGRRFSSRRGAGRCTSSGGGSGCESRVGGGG
jgi:hypothetical protein